MGSLEFDEISQGRIEKLTQETLMNIVKLLFEGIKTAGEKREVQRSSMVRDSVKSFKDFDSMLSQ